MPGYTLNPQFKSLVDVSLSAPSQGSIPFWHSSSNKFLDSVRGWNIAETVTIGLSLRNTSDSTASLDQFTPAIHLGGAGWKTASTAGSQRFDWRIYASGVQGSSAPASVIYLDYSINAGAYTTLFQMNSAGGTTFAGAVTSNSTVLGAALSVTGDIGAGVASRTIITNATIAAGTNAPTTINVPGSGAAAQVGWMKVYIGTTAYAVPYWAAA